MIVASASIQSAVSGLHTDNLTLYKKQTNKQTKKERKQKKNRNKYAFLKQTLASSDADNR